MSFKSGKSGGFLLMYFFLLLYCFCGVCLSLIIGLNSTLFVNFGESLYGVFGVLFSSLRGAIFLKSFISFWIFLFAVFSDFLLKIQQSVNVNNITQYSISSIFTWYSTASQLPRLCLLQYPHLFQSWDILYQGCPLICFQYRWHLLLPMFYFLPQ